MTWGDGVVFLGLALLLYLGIRLGLGAPAVIKGPEIELAPRVLPYYVGLSLGRMVAAYILSIIFSMVFGYLAARNRTAEKFLIPLLDVLQSVPILSFLPVVLLSLSAILPIPWAVELSSIVLIFTSQAWNIDLRLVPIADHHSPQPAGRPAPSSASTAGCALRPWSCPLPPSA